MADSYFIKRGEKVSGPFSADQVNKLGKDGKFRDDDGVSNRQDGPWTPVAKAFKKQQVASHQQNATAEAETPATEPSAAPRTQQCEDCGGVVSKRAAVCPHCGAPIVSDAEEQQQSPSADASPSPMSVKVVQDYGTLTVIRRKKVDGWAARLALSCDGVVVANLKNGETVDLQLPAGLHTFLASMWTMNSEVKQLNIVAGEKTNLGVYLGGTFKKQLLWE